MKNPKITISRPMHFACKVCVFIPVYDEPLNVALMPLLSLGRQQGVSKEDYEVVFVVNNTKDQAKQNSSVFLQNQKIISFLNFINGNNIQCPIKLSAEQKKQVAEIKNSGLVVHVIDLSSLALADQNNTLGLARDLGGREICNRFKATAIGQEGVIAITDCDCHFSDNYIYELIETFKMPEINGVVGKWLTEVSKDEPNAELLEQAAAIHLLEETAKKNYRPPREKLPLQFQKKDKMDKIIFINAQNMAVRVIAFMAVGGILHVSSFEDIVFGYKVTELSGETVYNRNFWISTLIRPSERAGLNGFGRRVKIMAESINNFVLGQTEAVYIPDKKRMFHLFQDVYKSARYGQLTEEVLLKHLEFYGVNHLVIPKQDINSLLSLLTRELSTKKSVNPNGLNEITDLVLLKFYHHLPKVILTAG